MSNLRRLLYTWRAWPLRMQGVEIPEPNFLRNGISVRHILAHGQRGTIKFGPGAMLCRGAVVESWGGEVIIGQHVFLGPHSVIYGHGGVKIGDNSLISMHCRILSSNHTIPPQGQMIREHPDELKATRIGRDVWLGAGVTVLAGVTIGDGAVVGAGAVVTKGLPPGCIAMGSPAKVHSWRAGAENPTT